MWRWFHGLAFLILMKTIESAIILKQCVRQQKNVPSATSKGPRTSQSAKSATEKTLKKRYTHYKDKILLSLHRSRPNEGWSRVADPWPFACSHRSPVRRHSRTPARPWHSEQTWLVTHVHGPLLHSYSSERWVKDGWVGMATNLTLGIGLTGAWMHWSSRPAPGNISSPGCASCYIVLPPPPVSPFLLCVVRFHLAAKTRLMLPNPCILSYSRKVRL